MNEIYDRDVMELLKKKEKKVISMLNDCCKDKKYILFFFAIKSQANENYARGVIKSRCNKSKYFELYGMGVENNEDYKKKRTACYNFLYLFSIVRN